MRDPLGNVWWLQARLEEVDLEEMGKRAAEKRYLDAMRYAQQSLDHEMRSRGREYDRPSCSALMGLSIQHCS